MVRVARRLALVIVFFSAACSEPPNKEMNLAQGAIEAARAAGAERFAATELAAAVDTLKKSNDAAADNDYRQALNHALDSFERAQNAAKLAVEGRANARGEAERAVAQVATLLATAETQIKTSPLPARSLNAPRQTIAAAGKALQEARTALEKEDYLAVSPALDGVAARLQAALKQIDTTPVPPPARRKR